MCLTSSPAAGAMGGSAGPPRGDRARGCHHRRELLRRKQRQLAETKVAVQGTATSARRRHHPRRDGCQVVAVSDVTGGLYNPHGLDVASLNRHVAAHPRHWLEGYSGPGVERIRQRRAADDDTHVLIPRRWSTNCALITRRR